MKYGCYEACLARFLLAQAFQDGCQWSLKCTNGYISSAKDPKNTNYVYIMYTFLYILQTWNFTAHAHKTASLFPIVTANEFVHPIPVHVVCAKFCED
jgi:hypothetical protein